MPKHILRLIILFVIVIVLFLIARHFLVPETFGDLGHYRAEAIEDAANQEVRYIQSDDCGMCHDSVMTMKMGGAHKLISCETCHGPGYLHVEDPTTENINKENGREFCGNCHTKNAARSKSIKQIDIEVHNTEGKCIECHNPHKPWN